MSKTSVLSVLACRLHWNRIAVPDVFLVSRLGPASLLHIVPEWISIYFKPQDWLSKPRMISMIAIHLVSFALLCDFISWREWNISKTLFAVTKTPFFFSPLPFFFSFFLASPFLFSFLPSSPFPPLLYPVSFLHIWCFFLSFRVLLCSPGCPQTCHLFPSAFGVAGMSWMGQLYPQLTICIYI